MYDCSKINRLTVIYKSVGPGRYAGENREIIEGEDAKAICEEANRREVSIEHLMKLRSDVESVVINMITPLPGTEDDTPGKRPEPRAES
ncbi:MAG: hypothetical protein LVQ96_03560 [Thermoplasmatales archaeon]|nr:hypothetical protein [Thermoplasmatales archaeon]MCW6170228.1 hypothetical protein [Thermoplasmatales archaeon]